MARTGGLRERKRIQTRQRLTEAAMKLFLERGFEATTLDDIAAAAEVSRRTFFHYFTSKEEVVFDWQDEQSAALLAVVADIEPGRSPLEAAENAILAIIGGLAHDQALAVARLVQGSPALMARDQLKNVLMEQALGEVLARRFAGSADALETGLAAMMAVGAARVATRTWLADGGREKPVAYARRAFAALHHQHSP
jgi:AcrR family transcriptional regulator